MCPIHPIPITLSFPRAKSVAWGHSFSLPESLCVTTRVQPLGTPKLQLSAANVLYVFFLLVLTERAHPESGPARGLVPAGHSVDPGSAGLLGRRGPRSKQPFMVTFFRAGPGPARVTRAAKPPRRRQPKKTNDLPHPNKLPGIFGKIKDNLFVGCLARNPNFGPEMQPRGAKSSGFLERGCLRCRESGVGTLEGPVGFWVYLNIWTFCIVALFPILER